MRAMLWAEASSRACGGGYLGGDAVLLGLEEVDGDGFLVEGVQELGSFGFELSESGGLTLLFVGQLVLL